MNAIFKNLQTDGLAAAEDRLGGYSVLPTGYYEATIKMAYAGQSTSGAHNVTLIADIDGREYRETIYVTNKQGENFFLDQNDKTKKIALPGFRTVDDICLLTVATSLSEMESEEKVVKVYDAGEGKEVPKAVQAFTALIGQKVGLAIVHQIEDKTKKEGTQYVPTGESRDVNVIEKAFHAAMGLTTVEIRNGDKEPAFKDAWIAKHKDKPRDKRAKGNAGAPAARSGPPQAGGPKKNSLFANV